MSQRFVSFGSIALSVSVSAGLLAAGPVSRSSAQVMEAPDLVALRDRASDYVLRYFAVMTHLTAEERYQQEIVRVRSMSVGPTSPPSGLWTAGNVRRDLRSDIQLVTVGPPIEWRVYRDVFEENGRPVRDRVDRLARLFLQPAEAAREQAERIAEESSRFNLGQMGRVLNEPGLPLVFLLPTLRSRFTFGLDKRDGDVWILRYEETTRPTLFRHNQSLPNPSLGRFWIDPRTGEVRQAEHVVSPSDFKATFTTQFRSHDTFGVALPSQMREELWTGVGGSARRVEGIATYSAFRRFAVVTDEIPSRN